MLSLILFWLYSHLSSSCRHWKPFPWYLKPCFFPFFFLFLDVAGSHPCFFLWPYILCYYGWLSVPLSALLHVGSERHLKRIRLSCRLDQGIPEYTRLSTCLLLLLLLLFVFQKLRCKNSCGKATLVKIRRKLAGNYQKTDKLKKKTSLKKQTFRTTHNRYWWWNIVNRLLSDAVYRLHSGWIIITIITLICIVAAITIFTHKLITGNLPAHPSHYFLISI